MAASAPAAPAEANPTKDQDVAALYEYSTKLDQAGVNVGKHEDIYAKLLEASKGSRDAKKLSTQIIPKYFKYFPNRTDDAINALVDLCEEDDVTTRILTIKALPLLCRDTQEHIPRIADVLGQLLQTELAKELDNVKQSLVTLLRKDPKATLSALFNLINTGDNENLRAKVISFLFEKLTPMINEVLHPNEEAERHLADHIKKVLEDVSEAEFKTFLDILSRLKIFSGPKSVELLDIVADQINADAEFKPTDADNVERLLVILGLALPYIKKGQSSSKLVGYLANKVLPAFKELSEAHTISVLRVLAEVSPHVTASDAKVLLPGVYTLLHAHIPTDENQKLYFSYIEYLLFIFHQLAAKAPGSLANICGLVIVTGQPSDTVLSDSVKEKQTDFLGRLKFLEGKAAAFLGQLEEAANKAVGAQKESANLTLQITKNILQMVKALTVKIPVFMRPNQIKLSYSVAQKPAAAAQNANNNAPKPQKRAVPDTPAEDKKEKKPREVYVPPSRQSGRTPQFPLNDKGPKQGGRGRGRGRGRF